MDSIGSGRIVVQSAFVSIVCLLAVPLVFVVVSALLFPSLPASGNIMTLFSILLIGCTAGGALWGYFLGRISHNANLKRLSWAGAITFGPAFFIAAVILNNLEEAFSASGRLHEPGMHFVFLISFFIAVFLVAGLSGLALGTASQNWGLAIKLLLSGGLTASLAFVGIDLIMYLLGWQVGNPNFPQRATMQTVMSLGLGAAALVGGITIGLLLNKQKDELASTPFP